MRLNNKNVYPLQKLIDHIRICVIDSSAEEQLAGRPMSKLALSEDGHLCFINTDFSYGSDEFNSDREVFLIYTDPDTKCFYSASGKASLIPEMIKARAKAFLKKLIADDRQVAKHTLLKIESMKLEEDNPLSFISFLMNKLNKQ